MAFPLTVGSRCASYSSGKSEYLDLKFIQLCRTLYFFCVWTERSPNIWYAPQVKILSLSPDVQIDSLPATFIDTTTISENLGFTQQLTFPYFFSILMFFLLFTAVLSPPRKRAHVAQVQVMADAQTCSWDILTCSASLTQLRWCWCLYLKGVLVCRNMTAVTEPSAQFEFTYASSSPSVNKDFTHCATVHVEIHFTGNLGPERFTLIFSGERRGNNVNHGPSSHLIFLARSPFCQRRLWQTDR